MINEDKVAIMTRMAAYEAREGRRDLAVCSYFKGDYVGFQLLKGWIGITIAFGILTGVYVLYQFETIMQEVYTLDLFAMGRKFTYLYLVTCVVYLAAAWIIAAVRYTRASNSVAGFRKALDLLDGNEEEK